ncbi:MAG: DUF4402 domain-containing protein [Alphaproteobacteria bacterium]|nr:DUF4402 domain-containing protein [Alphaproteobacteria bacterium]MBN2779439.1 DUF4402 domain-containing protein [Alphaproteobacteria bacterium]
MNTLFKSSTFALSIFFASGVMAATGSGHAQAELSNPLTITNSANINFGTIAIDPGTGPQTVGLNRFSGGLVSCPATYVCSGTTHYGQIALTGAPNTGVNINLGATGILSDGSGHLITFEPYFIPAGSHEHTSSLILDASGLASFNVIGEITFSGAETAGTYSSANSGGSGYTITVNY